MDTRARLTALAGLSLVVGMATLAVPTPVRADGCREGACEAVYEGHQYDGECGGLELFCSCFVPAGPIPEGVPTEACDAN